MSQYNDSTFEDTKYIKKTDKSKNLKQKPTNQTKLNKNKY